MDHLQVWELEKSSEAGDVRWMNWADRVEDILDCADLDEWSADLSLIDHAYAAFSAGVTVADYVLVARSLRVTLIDDGAAAARISHDNQYAMWRERARTQRAA